MVPADALPLVSDAGGESQRVRWYEEGAGVDIVAASSSTQRCHRAIEVLTPSLPHCEEACGNSRHFITGRTGMTPSAWQPGNPR